MRSSIILILLLLVSCSPVLPHTVVIEVSAPETNLSESVNAYTDTSVLSATRLVYEVESESYAFGDFITSVAGISGGDEHYWAVYVDGEYASEGAGTLEIGEYSSIEWRLEPIDSVVE